MDTSGDDHQVAPEVENSVQQEALQQQAPAVQPSQEPEPSNAEIGAQKAAQEATAQVKTLLKKFDWTDGNSNAAVPDAQDAFKQTFAEEFAKFADGGSEPKQAAKKARNSACKSAKSAIEPHAVALAKDRANKALGDGTAFANLDPSATSAKDGYEHGTVGTKAKHYATALNGKTPTQMASLLEADQDATRSDCTLGNGKPQWSWSFTDDSLVRVKPNGDQFTNEPMFCVEVLMTNTTASAQDAVAFKTDDQANAVPKGPGDVNNPYDKSKHTPQYEGFLGVMLQAGHRQAVSE